MYTVKLPDLKKIIDPCVISVLFHSLSRYYFESVLKINDNNHYTHRLNGNIRKLFFYNMLVLYRLICCFVNYILYECFNWYLGGEESSIIHKVSLYEYVYGIKVTREYTYTHIYKYIINIYNYCHIGHQKSCHHKIYIVSVWK